MTISENIEMLQKHLELLNMFPLPEKPDEETCRALISECNRIRKAIKAFQRPFEDVIKTMTLEDLKDEFISLNVQEERVSVIQDYMSKTHLLMEQIQLRTNPETYREFLVSQGAIFKAS